MSASAPLSSFRLSRSENDGLELLPRDRRFARRYPPRTARRLPRAHRLLSAHETSASDEGEG